MKKIFYFLCSLLALCIASPAIAATDYGIFVGETKVTSDNANDILGDGGHFKYNASTKTLTVNNATLDNSGSLGTGISNREVDGLKISFEGNSRFNTRNSAIHSSKSFSIVGSGTLNAISTDTYAFMFGGTGITCNINGPKLYFYSLASYGLYDYSGKSNLNMWGSTTLLSLVPKDGVAAIYNLSSLTIGSLFITKPTTGYFSPSLKSITTDGKTPYKDIVVIQSATYYGLTIGETKVHNYNCDDILGDGMFKYVPSGKSLYVNKGTLTNNGSLGSGISNHEVDGLTIYIMDTCTFNTRNSVIASEKSFAIKGGALLTGKSTSGYPLYLHGDGITCTIDGTTLDFSSNGATLCDYYQSCTLSLQGNRTNLILQPNGNEAIKGLGSLVISDELCINEPLGGYFSSSLKSITLDGTSAYKGKVSIAKPEEYGLSFCDTKVTATNAADIMGDGSASYDPTTKTLNLKGNKSFIKEDSNIDYYYGIKNENVDGLTINVQGNVSFRTLFPVIYTDKSITIKGQDANLTSLCGLGGVLLHGENTTFRIDIKEFEVYVGKESAIVDYTSSSKVIIGANSTVQLVSTDEYSAFDGLKAFEMEGDVVINEPNYGYFSPELQTITVDGETPYLGRVTIHKPFGYGIYIAETLVTSANYSDVLHNGQFSYERGSKTLTVTDADLSNAGTLGSGITNREVNNFVIDLVGNSTISSRNYVIGSRHNFSITGSGSLTGVSSEGEGLYLTGSGTTCTINGPHLDLKGFSAVRDYTNTNTLVVSGEETNVTLNTSNVGKPTISGLFALKLNDELQIAEPEGGYFDSSLNSVTTDGQTAYNRTIVICKPAKEYGLYIAGISVNSDNAADILGNGEMSYDAQTHTLTMNNVTIDIDDVDGIVNEGIENLTIVAHGYNTIFVNSTEHSNIAGLATTHSLNITGDGVFEICSIGKTMGFICTNLVTINGPFVKSSSETFAYLGGTLQREGKLTVLGTGTKLTLSSGAGTPPFVQLKSLSLGDGLYITHPFEGYFDDTLGGITTDGETYYTDSLFISNMPALEPVAVAPDDLVTETYIFKAKGPNSTEAYSHPIQVGFSGNNVYICGLTDETKNMWAKGVVSDDKATIMLPEGQHIGSNTSWFFGYSYDYFLTSVDDDYNYTQLKLNYDAQQDCYTSSQPLVVISSEGKNILYMEEYHEVVIAKLEDIATMPTVPSIEQVNIEGAEYPSAVFSIPTVDVNGRDLLTSKLYYAIWYVKNGEEQQYVVRASEYEYVKEDMFEIPYEFTDNYDIHKGGSLFYFNPTDEPATWTKFGVQSIYYGGGVRNESQVVWSDGDITDGIKDLNGLNDHNVSNNIMYKQGSTIVNLAGQQIENRKLPRGIYIVGGKKVMVK